MSISNTMFKSSNLPIAGTVLFGGLATLGDISNSLAKGLLKVTQACAVPESSGIFSDFSRFSTRAGEK